MSSESIDPIRPVDEPEPGEKPQSADTQSQDYVSELREELESESKQAAPVRKTGFFQRFARKSKPETVTPPAVEPVEEPLADETLAALPETAHLADSVSIVPLEMEAETESTFAEVEFSQPEPPPVDLEPPLWEPAESDSPAAPEESSQWKTFLSTLWKPSEATEEEEDVIDDETLASRVESALPAGAEQDRMHYEEQPFSLEPAQPVEEPPEGKRITGSLVLDEGDDVFPEGSGSIWGNLRQELQETGVDEELPEAVIEEEGEEEDIPFTNIALSEWESLPEEVAESSALGEAAVDVEEEEFVSRPFSEQFAHVFGEESEEPGEPLPEPSVDEIRTIALEDYEDAGDVDIARKRSSRRTLRTVLLILIGAGILILAGVIALPSILNLISPPQPVPAAASLQPTEIPMEGMPYPNGVKMTGGWFFFLQPSNIEDGRWVPLTNEWLNGSELRRVVALPWTKQLEAVVQSLVVGDTIELHMSNGDILIFLVQETAQIERSDVSILSSNTPSLALVLYNQEDDRRWVVIANLNE